MSGQPLIIAAPTHEKVAGYKMPTNPKLWQSEIIRYLKSQHPYLPLDTAEIDIRRMDAAKGAAVGSVVLNSQVAIPIIIGRPRPGSDPELAAMDVFFHKGKYRFLDPESIKNVTHSPQIGEPETGKDSRAVGGNPYIGDMTGDATPLEYSGQASPFAGPYDGTKVSCDLSTYLMPERLRKEAGKTTEKMKERGALFGTTGAIGGTVRGLVATKGGAKKRALEALRQGAIGALAGGAAGAGSVPVIKALHLDKKEAKERRKVIKDVVRREIKKESEFTAGIDAVVDGGLVARMLKNAYLEPNDVTNFRKLLATSPHILQGSGNNFRLIEIVAKRGPQTTMSRGSYVKHPNIMQVYERQGVVYIKFSGGPEKKTTKDELKAVVGDRFPEIMSRLRSGNVFMQHDGVQQVSWDVKGQEGEAKVITGDGLYSARTLGGDNVVGMVCQAVVDFDGKTLPLKLFVSPDGKYALTGELFGVKLASKHRLPSQVPSGGQSGVFINYVHGTPISSLPLRLLSTRTFKPADGDERLLYIVQNPMTGQKFTLSPVPGVQGFERMRVVDPGVRALADGDIYYMPADSEWVRLRMPVRLAENETELSKISGVETDMTHVTYGAGMWSVDAHLTKEAFSFLPAAGAVKSFAQKGWRQASGMLKSPKSAKVGITRAYGKAGGGLKGVGAVAKKYAPAAAVGGGAMLAGGMATSALTPKQASWNDLDEPGARELLVSMGMGVDDAQKVLDQAHERPGLDRGVKIAGLHGPQLQGHEICAAPSAEYDQATIDFAAGCRPGPGLLKAAAESGHPETLDTLLSLEFITPQNLKYFVDNLPDFEETETRLAALLVAVRLGMQHVPEQPVKEALEGLAKTIDKLQLLKSAIDHRKQRATEKA
jgi:hypothetical protein